MTPLALLILIRFRLTVLDRKRDRLDKLWAELGPSIRKERRRRKIPLKKFARNLRCSTTFVAYLEGGKRPWTLKRAEKAVKLLTRREQWPE